MSTEVWGVFCRERDSDHLELIKLFFERKKAILFLVKFGIKCPNNFCQVIKLEIE